MVHQSMVLGPSRSKVGKTSQRNAVQGRKKGTDSLKLDLQNVNSKRQLNLDPSRIIVIKYLRVEVGFHFIQFTQKR